jgi:hypothetical protein
MLASKSTILYGFVLIVIIVALSILVLRLFRMQQRVAVLEGTVLAEKQRAWLLAKKQQTEPPQRSTRDVVLDVLMEIENIKETGKVQCSEDSESPDEDEGESPSEQCWEEVAEATPAPPEEAPKSEDPRMRPFSIFTSLFGSGGSAIPMQRPKAQIVEIIEE